MAPWGAPRLHWTSAVPAPAVTWAAHLSLYPEADGVPRGLSLGMGRCHGEHRLLPHLRRPSDQ